MAHNLRQNHFSGKWQLTIITESETLTYFCDTKAEALEKLTIFEAIYSKEI